jgi:hypothetical protein
VKGSERLVLVPRDVPKEGRQSEACSTKPWKKISQGKPSQADRALKLRLQPPQWSEFCYWFVAQRSAVVPSNSTLQYSPMEGRWIQSSIRDSRFETLHGDINVIVGGSTSGSHHGRDGEPSDCQRRHGGETVCGAKRSLLMNLQVSESLTGLAMLLLTLVIHCIRRLADYNLQAWRRSLMNTLLSRFMLPFSMTTSQAKVSPWLLRSTRGVGTMVMVMRWKTLSK